MTAPQNRQARRRAASLGGAVAAAGGSQAGRNPRPARQRGPVARPGGSRRCTAAVPASRAPRAQEPRDPLHRRDRSGGRPRPRQRRRRLPQCSQLRPGFLPALVNCAACLADLGELGDSIELYQAALKADPNSAVVRHNLAQALARLGRTAEAVPHLRALATSRNTASDHAALAEALDIAGDRDGALASYENALKLGAPVAPTRVLMARVELVRGNLERPAPISARHWKPTRTTATLILPSPAISPSRTRSTTASRRPRPHWRKHRRSRSRPGRRRCTSRSAASMIAPGATTLPSAISRPATRCSPMSTSTTTSACASAPGL
jgi:hypothetical protein